MLTEQEFINNSNDLAKQIHKDILHTYKNGNHYVSIYSDGTRYRETIDPDATKFEVDFPYNADVKITDYCDTGCAYCHENSSMHGRHADLSLPIFDTWKPYTEIAIGGGNALAHPDLVSFLHKMNNQNVICNLTINQRHLKPYYDLIKNIIDNKLVGGIGISLTNSSNDEDIRIINEITKANNNNVVIHTIAGILTENDIKALVGRKVLILGYKNNVGRGKTYYSKNVETNINWLKNNLNKIKSLTRVISFDNLSLAQLDVKRTLNINDADWSLIFQGKDYGDADDENGPTTFYFDAVNQMIGRSSTQPYNERIKYTNQTFIEAWHDSLSNYKVNNSDYGELISD